MCQVFCQNNFHTASVDLTETDLIHERLHVEDTASRGLQPVFRSERIHDPLGIEPVSLVLDPDPEGGVCDLHLEMDAAFAAHYAWIRIQTGDCDTAIVSGWGKNSEGELEHERDA